MTRFLLFLLALTAVIWMAVGAEWINTADDALDAVQGLWAAMLSASKTEGK